MKCVGGGIGYDKRLRIGYAQLHTFHLGSGEESEILEGGV